MSNLTPRLSADDIVARDMKSELYSAWNIFLIFVGIGFVGFVGGLFGGALGAYLWERFTR